MSTAPAPPGRDPGATLPPHPVLERYYASARERQATVNKLFDDTALHYDRITGLMSFGTGRRYRRQVLERLGVRAGAKVIDLACGTGQVSAAAMSLVGPSGLVVGVDPSEGMRRAAEASRGIRTLDGRADHIPVDDASFDFVVMGYALRHASDLLAAFREMGRVLRPGGTVCILEITPPERPLPRALLKFYLKHIVPPLSLAVTRRRRAHELMRYYWDSIENCVPPRSILDAMKAAGLAEPRRDRTLGIFNEYIATRPLASS